jgi:hypothetical protein
VLWFDSSTHWIPRIKEHKEDILDMLCEIGVEVGLESGKGTNCQWSWSDSDFIGGDTLSFQPS